MAVIGLGVVRSGEKTDPCNRGPRRIVSGSTQVVDPYIGGVGCDD